MSHHCPLHWLSGSLFLLCLTALTPLQAQIARDTTLPNPSVVTPKGNVNVITGGTQKGVNLFHSFQQFSIPNGKAASFQHNSEIDNIISRVTGSSGSKINGLLEVLENSGNSSSANFFLINPNGLLFGPNASLNIGGSFVASTASSIKFAGDSEFSATNPNSPSSSLLTVNVPLGLQFGTTPGKLRNESLAPLIDFSTGNPVLDDQGQPTPVGLQVTSGRTLALVGGKIELDSGLLFAPDGRIELGSVAGPGLVSLTPKPTGFALDYKDIQTFQDIRLSGGATVAVSGDAGGDVTIRARNLQVQDGSQIGSVAFVEGEKGTVTVKATDAIELTGTSADGTESALLSVITGNEGIGSNLIISTPQLVIKDGARIFSLTYGQAQGGDITVAADSVKLSGISSTGEASGIVASTEYIPTESGDKGGKGGDITIYTKQLDAQQGSQVLAFTNGSGPGGDLTVTADDSVTVTGHSLEDSKKSDLKEGDFANIRISGLLAQTQRPEKPTMRDGYGDAGQLKIETRQLRVLDGAQIASTTFTDGRAGDMLVQAPIVELAGVALSKDGQLIPSNENPFIPSGLFASADRNSTGKGGTLIVGTRQLSLQDGAVLQTSTLGSGDAGELTIRGLNSSAADSVEVVGTAKGGLYPTSIQALSGGLPETGRGVREATGRGGNLRINAGRLLVQDGAAVAVGSLNKTNEAKGAGNLNVQAQTIYLNNRGELTAATASGDGGNIRLQAQDVLLLSNNSNISTNAGIAGTIGQGGNITIIDTGNLVALGNSDITANATKDRGGEVNITAEGVFGTAARERQTPASDITASSDLGPQFSGIVQINTPDVDPSEGLTNLPTQPVNTEIAQDCQAGGGKTASRFINSGSGGLPTNPYEPLDSSDILAEVQLPAQWADAENTGTLPRQQMPLQHTSASTQATQSSQIIEAQGWSVNDKGEVSLVAEIPSASFQRGCRLR